MRPVKELEMEVDVATHLGIVSGTVSAGIFDEDDVKIVEEIDFSLIVENGRTVGFSGTDDV